MPTKNCLNCGIEFHIPNCYMNRVHCCSKMCSYALRDTKERRNCVICNTPFLVRHNSKRQFCSNACKLKPSPENKTVKPCARCGKDFESWTYRKQIYCSLKCKNIVAAHQPKPKRSANIITLTCEWCNKSYQVHQCMNTGKRKSRFCSVECRGKHFSATNRGAKHPNWRGGGKYPDRGRNWSAQRRLTLIRDNQSCQICHKKMNEKNKHLIDVHHIKPYREFNGDYLSANELTNLITLCRSCHKRVEHGKIPCPVKML